MTFDSRCTAAIERLVSYTLENEEDFVREEFDDESEDSDYDSWAEWLLEETVYGAALVTFYKGEEPALSNAVKELWDLLRS